jgi:hypothetical protein
MARDSDATSRQMNAAAGDREIVWFISLAFSLRLNVFLAHHPERSRKLQNDIINE